MLVNARPQMMFRPKFIYIFYLIVKTIKNRCLSFKKSLHNRTTNWIT